MAQVAKVTIDSTQVASDLTDFPVYIDLSDMPALFWSTVANGGGDIRVYKSDGTTELPREVVFCDTGTQTGELHVKYTGTLSSTVDTEIQIHADGTSSDYAVGDTYGRNAVWSGYNIIHHLQSSALDSTGNTSPTAANMSYSTGKIGNCGVFNGSSSQITTTSGYTDSALTVSFLINKTTDTFQRPFTFSGSSGTTSTGTQIVFGLSNTGISYGGSSSISNPADLTDSVWHKVDITHTGTTGTIYIDGSQLVTGTVDALSTLTDYFPRLGRASDNSNPFWFDGSFDEFRLDIGTVKTSDWISAEYTNQNTPSTFYTATSPSVTFTITDTMALGETTTNTRTRLSTIVETLNLTEVANAFRVMSFTIVDTLHLSDTISNIRTRLSSIVDSLGLSEILNVRLKWREREKSSTSSWTETSESNADTWTETDKSA